MSIELAIIVLNYRTADLTIGCVESLRGEIRPGIRVVVVDNASGDGSADRIEDHILRAGYDGWAEVVRSPVNGGFAAGNNLGIRAVLAKAYMLLNSDTVVRPGAIAGLLGALERHPKVGILGPSFEGSGGEPEQSCFRFPHPASEFVRAAGTGLITKVLQRFNVPMPFSESPVEPDWIAFACVVIRREVIDQVGLLDEGYFMYFEDVDYCRKVRAAGWTILYWPEPRVVHFMGGSSQISSADTVQRRRARYFYEARARYFAQHFGVAGLFAANALWTAGRAISFSREVIERKPRHVREREVLDVWINMLVPFRTSRAAPRTSPAAPGTGSAAESDAAREPASGVDVNTNPTDLGLIDLLREDFETHQRDLLSPGFWAVAVHRFGNWRMGIHPKLARAPFSLIHRTLFTSVDWMWGINLGTDVRLGRRVRIWHHGGMVLGARAIGDDVQIRHNTTFCDPGRNPSGQNPTIQDRVDIGIGVCILGNVTVGHDTVIGPNAVVLASCPPHSRLLGVPARPEAKAAVASVAHATKLADG